MSAAARQGDPIAHTSALGGLLTGLALGATAALIGVAVVGTGGLAVVAVVGAAAATGAGIGEVLGSLSIFTHDTGPITTGSSNVYINGRPAARAHLSTVLCSKHGPHLVAEGSNSVYINDMPAARIGDHSTCGGTINAGSTNVFIGDGSEITDAIEAEVPAWLRNTIMGVGLGSAAVLASPAVLVAGLMGGTIGGIGGHKLGGKWFGEGSDGQKLMALGGAILGGGVSVRGGKWFDARYQIKMEGLGSNFGNVKIVKKPILHENHANKISPDTYQKLRAKTPSKAIQKFVNENISLPREDPALPGLQITKPLHADHIVPMKQITNMKGFSEPSTENQLQVLNNPKNFVGLSETANTSKGAKSFSEWTEYKKLGIKVDRNFRENMINKSQKTETDLREQIAKLLTEQGGKK